MTLRQERISKVLVQQTSEIIRKLRDPRLGFLTVTGAKVAPDLKTARIAVSVFGEAEERQESIRVLQIASGYIRKELGRTKAFKSVPALEFQLDEGAIHSARVQELLHNLELEQPDQ